MTITDLYKFFSKAPKVDVPEVNEPGSRDILHEQNIPEIMCQYDEAFTIDEMLEETSICRNCSNTDCPNCGKEII